VAALCGAGPRLASEIDVASSHLRALADEWGPDGEEQSLAKHLAQSLHGTVPVITGAGLTAALAYRWKTQINENAKSPAFWGELPELDHNEIAGWGGAPGLAPLSAIFLDDSDIHPRLKARIELTRRVIAPSARFTESVASRGQTTVERVCSLVLLGDLVSCYMAILAGVDPTPVDVLTELKQALAEPD